MYIYVAKVQRGQYLSIPEGYFIMLAFVQMKAILKYPEKRLIVAEKRLIIPEKMAKSCGSRADKMMEVRSYKLSEYIIYSY